MNEGLAGFESKMGGYLATAVVLAAAGGALWWWLSDRVGTVTVGAVESVKAAAQKVNPASDQNFAYQGASSLADYLDDGVANGSNTLGTWFYELTHRDSW